MNSRNLFIPLLLTTLLLTGGLSKSAVADRFCTPFLQGKVKQHVLDTMLDAALIGHLYRIQPATSRVGFCIDSKFKHVRGDFRDIEGGISMKPSADSYGQALLSINTDSISTSSPMIESVIKSKTFLDVAHYPEILFVSTGFEWLLGTAGVLEGNLTLHGVTKPVIFNVEVSDIKGNRVRKSSENILIRITTNISRADFGMERMAFTVSDSVKLCMSVRAKKTTRSCLQCHRKQGK